MSEKLGTVRIAPNVLATIAKRAALAVPGVARMAEGPAFVLRNWAHEGVRVEVSNDTVSIELYLIVEPGKSMLEISRAVQNQVARAIQDLLGMPVKEVDVHILDVA